MESVYRLLKRWSNPSNVGMSCGFPINGVYCKQYAVARASVRLTPGRNCIAVGYEHGGLLWALGDR